MCELEDGSKWGFAPLYTDHKLSSIYHFIYHLTTDLGNVAVMKALSQRGHSPRMFQSEEGTYHYPGLSQTLWADVGNAMYGHLNKELKLISDASGIKQVVAGDVIEIAYNLYAMYATLNIDVALLLNVDQSVSTRMVGSGKSYSERCLYSYSCNVRRKRDRPTPDSSKSVFMSRVLLNLMQRRLSLL